MKYLLLHSLPPLLFFFLTVMQPARAQVVNSEWNIANGNWNVASNWLPGGVPDNGGGTTFNVQIGNRPAAAGAQVTFVPQDGTADTISNLTISAGADLFTSGNQLNITTQTTLDGGGSTIRVDPHLTAGTAALIATNLDLNGGGLVMRDSVATVSSLLEINSGGVISGRGVINAGDTDATLELAFENSGLIQVQGTSTAPAILTLHANGVDTLDLDGVSETGILDVSNAVVDLESDTLTLVVDGPLSDPVGGTAGSAIQIGQGDTVTFTRDFALGANLAVQVDGGTSVATINGAGAATAISGTAFTVTGAAVIDNDLTFSGTANTITVGAASSLALNGAVTIPDATALSMATDSEWIIGGAVTVSEPAGNFNWDGAGAATTTVQGTGKLTLDVSHVDSTNDVFGGTLNLNDDADVSVTLSGTSWTVFGTLNKNNAGTSTVSGDPLTVTGNVNVNAGTLTLPATTLSNTADVTVNGLLNLGTASVLSGPTTLAGAGTLRMANTSTVAANTTVAVNTFDWDGSAAGSAQTIADGVIFTITSPNIDTDGDVDDPVSLGGNGAQLIVNGPAAWTVSGPLTANAAAAGTATIGGSSRLILAGTVNVDGSTNVSGPITFGAGSTVSIDAAMTLDVLASASAAYGGGTIGGAGTYSPGAANTVTANTLINSTNFDFDNGSWLIQNNAQLTVNVTDTDPGVTTNVFNGAITLNDGDISVTTGDVEFVTNGVLNFIAPAGSINAWSGEPLDIGNDTLSLDADLNVSGTGTSQIAAPTDFNSDADVNIAADARLDMLGTVNFDTVNGANNAGFTGAGTFSFSGGVNVNEAVTLNMTGGTVDLDGNDSVGDFINIDAPFTINAATLTSFGRVNSGGGINTLDINNSIGTGILTVNLDNAGSEWTLNAPGVMNLVNDNILAALLAGSPVRLQGTVNVTGTAGVTARVRLSGTTTITSGALVLQGGTPEVPNTLEGGTINGPGQIQAPALHALRGFGTINAPVNFSASADLVAADGLLDVNGALTLGGVLRVEAAPAVLDLANALSTANVAGGITLNGGTLQGAAVTTSTPARPIRGRGTVTSTITNSGALVGDAGTLTFTSTASDWDGAANAGVLRAENGGTLELRDTATFGFTGAVIATSGGRVFTSGFALDFNPGSSIQLTAGKYQSTNNTNIGGNVTVNAGADSTIEVRPNFPLNFESTSVTTLIGNLRVQNNSTRVFTGATFSGAGALIIPAEGFMATDPNAVINVLVDNQGALRVGDFNTIGRLDVRDYQQSSGGELFFEVTGTSLNQFDRVVVNGAAQVRGHLNLDIDGGFAPTVGQSFDILTATGGITGKFDPVLYSGLPAGLGFNVTYLPNAVRVTVAPQSFYDQWIEDRALEAQILGFAVGNLDRGKGADFDRDGLTNIGEFALNGHPFIGTRPNKISPKVASVGGSNVFTLTFPVRDGAVPDPSDPAGGELVLKQTADVLTYKIQAGDVLNNSWTLIVTEVTGAAAIQTGLPPLDAGWTYRTFRSPDAVAGDSREYMRVVITE